MALVLYLALTAVLAVASRRWVPWRSALVLIALPLLFTGPAALTNRAYAPLDLLHVAAPFGSNDPYSVHNAILTDVSHQIIPWNIAVRESVRAGEWPLWNRFMLAGDVLAASGQPAPYYPVTILSWLLPLTHALTFAAMMGFFGAGLGSYLFFRRMELGETASLFGAAAWMYATPVVFYLEWPLGTSIALLPLVLFGAEWLVRDAVPGAIALTVALTLLIFAGHPESIVHVVGAAAVYALVRFIALNGPLVSRRMSRRRPAADNALVELSARAPARGQAGSPHYTGTPVVRFVLAGLLAGFAALAITAIYLLPIQDALPQTVQYTFRREVFARMDRSVPWAEAGALALRTFVPFTYGRLAHDVADNMPQRYWLSDNGYAGSIVLALAIFGVIRSRRPVRWLFLGMALFGLLAGSDAPIVSELLAMLPLFRIALNERLIMLCAFGLVALAALGIEALEPRLLTIVSLATLVLLSLAVLLSLPVMRAAELSTELIAKNAAYLLVPLLLVAVIRKPQVIIVLLLAQRYLEIGDFWPTVDANINNPPLAAALPRGGEPYRVVGLGNILIPNSAAYLGLEDVRGYQAMNLTFFHETYGLWSLAPSVGPNIVQDLGAPFLSLMNVRYAFAARDAKLPDGWRSIGAEDGYQIAENSRVLPRAFIPKRVVCGVDALPAMTTETDFSERAWLRGDCPSTELQNGIGTVRTRRKTPARLSLEVDTDAPSWVVVTESAWRGWRAVDRQGRRLQLRRANHAFLAFEVPAGRTGVDLFYRPRSFVIGAIVSAVAAAAFAAFIMWRCLASYRRSSSSS